MCERASDEPYKKFFLRWLLENPQWICAAVEFVCIAILFVYFMDYIDRQIEVQRETVQQLTELSARIQVIERHLSK